MLEKAAKWSTLVQGIAAAVFLYTFAFPVRQDTSTIDPVVRPMTHPAWLPLTSVVLLGVVIIVSAILNFTALHRNKRIDSKPVELTNLRSQKLTIKSAVYGTGPENDRDVTDFLQNHLREGLVFDIENNSFGFDPARDRVKRLEVEYSYGNRSVRKISRPEYTRMVLPEDQEIERLKSEVQQAKQQPLLDTGLRSRTIALHDGLGELLDEHGPDPTLKQNLGESRTDWTMRVMKNPWREKLCADYRLRFGTSIQHLRDEMAKAEISELGFDDLINKAGNSIQCHPDQIEEIRKHLWKVAGMMKA